MAWQIIYMDSGTTFGKRPKTMGNLAYTYSYWAI